MKIFVIIMLPFLGSVLGSSIVFIMRNKVSYKLEKLLLGFASGVMLAACIWSLLLPSMEMSKGLSLPLWLPSSVGFLAGIFFLLLLDRVIPHLHLKEHQSEGIKSNLNKTMMMVLSLTLHNIPEGMAVGVVLAGMYTSNSIISFMGALTLSIGIALQNFPEGAVVSLPLVSRGIDKKKSFVLGILSGLVEPLAAFFTLVFANFVTPILPYLLSFASGAMIYVIVEDLIPDAQKGRHSDWGTIGVAFGFVLMMILDISLG